ncbi:MAG: SpoIIE family protein phosphatase [Rhodobacteraceae bacterium]|nr:SpoIIE family protein phosphatase [Paracoccaceae bacterium]
MNAIHDLVTPLEGLMGFETCHRSDVGRVRTLNEDSVLSQPQSGLWLVADGMGGHTAGDFASQTIVREMQSVGIPTGAADLHARFVARLAHANSLIRCQSEQLGGGTVGSTIAALLIQQDHFACIWSGDSRVYRMRGNRLTRVTRDHTEVQALLDAGSITREQAETWPRKNVITRAIGVTPAPECDMVEGALLNADLFLLCSDGLTEYYSDGELAEVLFSGATGSLERLCNQLVDTALARGGKDNVSALLVRCHNLGLPSLEPLGDFPEYRERT